MMCSSGALLFPQRLRSNTMDPAPGSVCFVPVYVAFACQTCDAPGGACRHCGGICCISCSMGCATQLQPDSQDSPRAIETVQHCTGGTEDHELKDNTVYSLLESLFVSSNHWHWVEESLYIRSQPLPELGVCYITGEDLSPRPLGTMGDWIRIAGVLSYHHAALVVFNLEAQPVVGKRIVTVTVQPEGGDTVSILVSGNMWVYRSRFDTHGIPGTVNAT